MGPLARAQRTPVTGDDMWWTIVASVGAGACVGALLGVLAALLMRAKREQALRVEVAVLRARIKTDDTVSAEREQALGRARDQLQGVFGDLARDSLQSNSEVFLQLAR